MVFGVCCYAVFYIVLGCGLAVLCGFQCIASVA